MDYQQILEASGHWLLTSAPGLIIGILAFIGGWYMSRFLSRQTSRLLRRTGRIDATIAPFLSRLVRYGILLVTVVFVLGQFGVQTTSILAVLGAVGLAIALALQGTLSDIAAGILLLWHRPLGVGEYVDAEGTAGTVVEVGLFNTRLRTYDGIYVAAANHKLWNSRITNYTRERTRMVETKVGIAYDADLSKARYALLEVAKDPRVLADPAPLVFVNALGASSVEIVLRSWVPTPEWWRTNVDFIERAKLALESAGVEIAFNRLDLNIVGDVRH